MSDLAATYNTPLEFRNLDDEKDTDIQNEAEKPNKNFWDSLFGRTGEALDLAEQGVGIWNEYKYPQTATDGSVTVTPGADTSKPNYKKIGFIVGGAVLASVLMIILIKRAKK